jgi:PII-like signaling protein
MPGRRAAEPCRRGGGVGRHRARRIPQGFGRRHSHEPTLWHKGDETPPTVIFVDTADHIERLLQVIEEVLPDVVAMTEQIREVRYGRHFTH